MRKLSDLLIVMLNYVQQKGDRMPHWVGMCHYFIEAKGRKLISPDEYQLVRRHLKEVIYEQAPDGYCPSYVDNLLDELLYDQHPMCPIIGWYNWYIWLIFDLKRKGL